MLTKVNTLPFLDRGNTPDWFHFAGALMRLEQNDSCHFIISSPSANLEISKALSDDCWEVYWRITHRTHNGRIIEGVSGSLIVETGELEKLFALKEPHDVATNNKGVRDGYFLSLPSKGNGRDGNPNISILLRDNMRRRLIEIINEQ